MAGFDRNRPRPMLTPAEVGAPAPRAPRPSPTPSEITGPLALTDTPKVAPVATALAMGPPEAPRVVPGAQPALSRQPRPRFQPAYAQERAVAAGPPAQPVNVVDAPRQYAPGGVGLGQRAADVVIGGVDQVQRVLDTTVRNPTKALVRGAQNFVAGFTGGVQAPGAGAAAQAQVAAAPAPAGEVDQFVGPPRPPGAPPTGPVPLPIAGPPGGAPPTAGGPGMPTPGSKVFSDGSGRIAATMTPAQIAAVGAANPAAPAGVTPTAPPTPAPAPPIAAPMTRGGAVPTAQAALARGEMNTRANMRSLINPNTAEGYFLRNQLNDADTPSKRALVAKLFGEFAAGAGDGAAAQARLAEQQDGGEIALARGAQDAAASLQRAQLGDAGETTRAALSRAPLPSYQVGADGNLVQVNGTSATGVMGPDGKPFAPANTAGALTMKDRYKIVQDRVDQLALGGAKPEQIEAERAKAYAELGIAAGPQGAGAGQFVDGQSYTDEQTGDIWKRVGDGWEAVKK